MPIIKGLSLGDKGVLVSSKKVASGFGSDMRDCITEKVKK